jgi:hypothetical protein
MTNEAKDEYREALLKVLASTTETSLDELPAKLKDDPAMISELLVERFKLLSNAQESVAGLLETGTALADRGDRWKNLAIRARDTLARVRDVPSGLAECGVELANANERATVFHKRFDAVAENKGAELLAERVRQASRTTMRRGS